MPYWVNFENARNLGLACAGNLCLALLLAGAGFVFMLARQKGFTKSVLFGGSVILVPMLMPAAACSLLITSTLITTSFLSESTTTTGQVTALAENSTDNGISYSAVVTFTTPDGQSVTFEDSSKTCAPPCNQVGDTVPVRYRVNSPQDAIISAGIDIWLTVGVFALLTVVFTVVGLFMAWQSYHSRDWASNAMGVVDAVTGY